MGMSSHVARHPGDAGPAEIGTTSGESLASCGLDEQRMLLRADGDPQMRRRLAALGLRRGAQVKLMMRTSGGGAVVQVAGSRIALDRSILRRLVTAGTEVPA